MAQGSIHRRFAHALRAQDWMGVAIELMIVILGVFLGIQAANWNGDRQDRAQERRYYGQIVTDLKRDVDNLKIAQERSILNDRAAEIMIAALHGSLPDNVSPDRLAKSVHYAGFLYLPTPSRRTYDELISTGNLRLIRNPEAKDAIASYYEDFADLKQWDSLLRQQQADYWSATAGIVPRKVLQAAIDDRDSGTTPSDMREIIERARATPRLENLLVGMAAHQARVRRDSAALEHDAKDLIAKLEPLAS